MGRPEGKKYLEDLGVDGKIYFILCCDFNFLREYLIVLIVVQNMFYFML